MASASRAGQSVQRRDVCKTFISYIQEIQNGAMVARAVVRETFVTLIKFIVKHAYYCFSHTVSLNLRHKIKS